MKATKKELTEAIKILEYMNLDLSKLVAEQQIIIVKLSEKLATPEQKEKLKEALYRNELTLNEMERLHKEINE